MRATTAEEIKDKLHKGIVVFTFLKSDVQLELQREHSTIKFSMRNLVEKVHPKHLLRKFRSFGTLKRMLFVHLPLELKGI